LHAACHDLARAFAQDLRDRGWRAQRVRYSRRP
jgi:hypothetical protein